MSLLIACPPEYNDKSFIVEHMIDVFVEVKPKQVVTQDGTLIHEMCQRIDLPVKTFSPENETDVGRLIMIVEMIRMSDNMLIFDDGNMSDYIYYGEKFRRKIKIVVIN